MPAVVKIPEDAGPRYGHIQTASGPQPTRSERQRRPIRRVHRPVPVSSEEIGIFIGVILDGVERLLGSNTTEFGLQAVLRISQPSGFICDRVGAG